MSRRDEDRAIVTVRLADGTLSESSIELTAASHEEWRIHYAPAVGDPMTATAPHAFAALRSLRNFLDPLGVKLLCVGACRDAGPSGMSISMGGGVLVYRRRLGEPATGRPVHILLPAPESEVGTVEEQDRFTRMWAESLRR